MSKAVSIGSVLITVHMRIFANVSVFVQVMCQSRSQIMNLDFSYFAGFVDLRRDLPRWNLNLPSNHICLSLWSALRHRGYFKTLRLVLPIVKLDFKHGFIWIYSGKFDSTLESLIVIQSIPSKSRESASASNCSEFNSWPQWSPAYICGPGDAWMLFCSSLCTSAVTLSIWYCEDPACVGLYASGLSTAEGVRAGRGVRFRRSSRRRNSDFLVAAITFPRKTISSRPSYATWSNFWVFSERNGSTAGASTTMRAAEKIASRSKGKKLSTSY